MMLKPLLVGAQETAFNARLVQESSVGPWLTLSGKQKQQLGDPMGPRNPQALNRYSYVQNNPLKYIDPSGHSVYMSQKQGQDYVDGLRELAKLLGNADFVTQFAAAVVGGAAGIAALLTQYGLASTLVAGLAPGLAIAAVLLAAIGLPIGLIASKWAEQLNEYADSVSTVVERSPSGIIVSNGCGHASGSVTETCGVVVVSRDDGNGVRGNLGPVGFLVGWGTIWTPGKAYNPDGSEYTGDGLYRSDSR